VCKPISSNNVFIFISKVIMLSFIVIVLKYLYVLQYFYNPIVYHEIFEANAVNRWYLFEKYLCKKIDASLNLTPRTFNASSSKSAPLQNMSLIPAFCLLYPTMGLSFKNHT